MSETTAATWLYDFHTGKPYRMATVQEEEYWDFLRGRGSSYMVVEDGTEDGVAVTVGQAPSVDEAD